MFFKIKNAFLILLLTFLIGPLNSFAYSDYIVASGENIGIKLNSKGIVVVGTYKVDNRSPGDEAGLKVGDIINSIDNKKISNVADMINVINNNKQKEVQISYERNGKTFTTKLELFETDKGYKTGLYVKDSITGVGTLTFVDPETKLFGALGHEIIESTTGKILDITDGTIFDSKVTGITKSNDGVPGEKNATFELNKVDGTVLKNTNKGIFGNYITNFDKSKLYKVAKVSDIKKGNAKIRTVLDDNDVDEYDVNIINVSDTDNNIKNIVFEVTDEKLLKKANGIVQGMSGSPIIQNEYIIGAVTHVFVDNPQKGYGILITNMLKEAEK